MSQSQVQVSSIVPDGEKKLWVQKENSTRLLLLQQSQWDLSYILHLHQLTKHASFWLTRWLVPITICQTRNLCLPAW